PGCRLYDAADHYVIIKDNASDKPKAYLILPTMKVTGIEDPQILEKPVVDFWQYAWARSATYPGRPPADTALAINSKNGRTQGQLHIHIACVQPDVKAALLGSDVPSYPHQPLVLQLKGHAYRVVKVGGLSGALSPFLLIQDNPAAKANMKDQS